MAFYWKLENASVDVAFKYGNSPLCLEHEKLIDELCKEDESYQELYAAVKRKKVRKNIYGSQFSLFLQICSYIMCMFIHVYIYICIFIHICICCVSNFENQHSENILHGWCHYYF